jgi:hypothetical protein
MARLDEYSRQIQRPVKSFSPVTGKTSPSQPRHGPWVRRSGPDELVPSRYALRIGKIDVLVVSDGVLLLPGAMLAPHPAVRAAWLDDMFLPPDAFDWLIRARAAW